jgi:hypothetical protein
MLMTECLSRLRVKYSLRDGKIAKEGIQEGKAKKRADGAAWESAPALGAGGR